MEPMRSDDEITPESILGDYLELELGTAEITKGYWWYRENRGRRREWCPAFQGSQRVPHTIQEFLHHFAGKVPWRLVGPNVYQLDSFWGLVFQVTRGPKKDEPHNNFKLP